MPQEQENDEILKEAKKSLQQIANLFSQAFSELLKEKQAQAIILIKLKKAVVEFKQLQEKLKKRGIEIDAKLESFRAELTVRGENKKIKSEPTLLITAQDDKFLKSLKIVPPGKENKK